MYMYIWAYRYKHTDTHTHVITVIFKNSYIHISTIMYHTVMILAPASSS